MANRFVLHFENSRLEGISGIYASLVAANGRVYVLGRDGTCLVLKQGKQLEVLAHNQLDDKTDASIALAGKTVDSWTPFSLLHCRALIRDGRNWGG